MRLVYVQKQIDKDKQQKLAAEAYKHHLVETEIKPKEEKLKKVKSQIIQLFDSVSDNASVYKCNLGNLSKDDFSNLISYLKELKCFVISGKEQSLYFIHFFKQGKDERIQLSQELFDSISLSVKLKKLGQSHLTIAELSISASCPFTCQRARARRSCIST